jgi:Na+/H+-dicarboxylate symporter
MTPSPRRIGARPAFILAGLALGLLAGILGPAALGDRFASVLPAAELIGGLWLDALRMTIVPLVFALVVTGMAGASATFAAGGITARALAIFIAMLLAAAIVTALIAIPALAAWGPDAFALQSLRAGTAPPPEVPPLAQSIRAFVPVNIVAAAAEGAIVPLVLFALLLGLAVTRIAEPRRAAMLELFHALADSMLVIIGWVLRLAPLGVAALALAAGARLGVGIGAALATYVLIQVAAALALIALCYLAVALFARTGLVPFARAAAPAQAVAFSTQSSLASLPPMVAGAERLDLPEPGHRPRPAARRRDLQDLRARLGAHRRHHPGPPARRRDRPRPARARRPARHRQHARRGRPAGPGHLLRRDRALGARARSARSSCSRSSSPSIRCPT